MLNISAKPFLGAAAELRAIQVLANSLPDKTVAFGDADRQLIIDHLNRLSEAIEPIGAKLAQKSVDRLLERIDAGEQMTYGDLIPAFQDIEGRFVDYLEEVAMYVVAEHEARWLADGDDLVGWELGIYYPSTIFEFEEAAKCIALGRHTASVFHSMRVLEIGIRAISKHLEIPDPVTASGRNWGAMLTSIKEEIDRKFPSRKRTAGSDGAFFEEVYSSLDAVRNPWRNATMHVETIYAPHEAEHIFNCVKFFMSKLVFRFGEDGEEVL